LRTRIAEILDGKVSMMNTKIADFLAQKRIAVAGVSRNPNGEAANLLISAISVCGGYCG